MATKADALLLGLDREAGDCGRGVDVAKEQVGGLDRGDPGQRQLLGQTVLQRLKDPLRATPRLRRIGRDMLDAEMLRAPGRPGSGGRAIDLAAASGV